VFIAGKYDDKGKWMDGWESRERAPGHDWCVIRLGARARSRREIDTAYFTGQLPARRDDRGMPLRRSGAPATRPAGPVTPRLDLKGNDRIYVPIDMPNR